MHQDDLCEVDNGNLVCKELVSYRGCYALAALIDDADFKDALVDSMIERMCDKKKDIRSIARYIYPHSSKGSRHKTFALDCALRFWPAKGFEDLQRKEYPEEFKADLLTAVGSVLREGLKINSCRKFFENIHACTYHEHGENSICYKKKQKFLS